MSQYSQWTRTYLKSLVKDEIMDSSNRWVSDGELNYYCEEWLDEVQQEMGIVWGSSTLVVVGNTNTILNNGGQFAPVFIPVSTLTPSPNKLEAFYWNGWRLSGRNLEDLEILNTDWRSSVPDTPRMVVQYDSNQFFLWPTPSKTGNLVMEYPVQLTLITDTSTVQLPFWCQYSAKPYICSQIYSRPGPIQDTKKALRYQKQYLDQLTKIKVIWQQYQPYRYMKLKPAGQYEIDILNPPPAMGDYIVGTSTSTITMTGGL